MMLTGLNSSIENISYLITRCHQRATCQSLFASFEIFILVSRPGSFRLNGSDHHSSDLLGASCTSSPNLTSEVKIVGFFFFLILILLENKIGWLYFRLIMYFSTDLLMVALLVGTFNIIIFYTSIYWLFSFWEWKNNFLRLIRLNSSRQVYNERDALMKENEKNEKNEKRCIICALY